MSPKTPLTDVRGSAASSRYRTATVEERFYRRLLGMLLVFAIGSARFGVLAPLPLVTVPIVGGSGTRVAFAMHVLTSSESQVNRKTTPVGLNVGFVNVAV
jgi:uncharacterized membrane protein YccC